RRMKHDERNFVNTRIWQVAHEIVETAMKYDAVIAIEKLKNLRKKSGKERKPKRANRKIHRIPFHKFKQAIQSVAWQHGIDVVEVPATKTSQRCPKCGYASKKNWVFFNGKRRLFKCRCGYEANVDRTASRNIATLALERGFVFTTLSTQPSVPEPGAMSAAPSGSMRVVGNISPPRASSSIYRGEADRHGCQELKRDAFPRGSHLRFFFPR
ncbi:MAG: Transposase, partial [Candidatus Alkanophagales archaeon MCA70_species_2]|nr:Transposase [Candidatus Alkanophaga liquidiphilum]